MTITYTGKPQLSREVNRRLILDRIRRNGEVSRADLAKITQIRPPTVTAIVKELLTEGLVEEIGAGETSGGRAPRLVALRRHRARALGFEVTETAILAATCDLAGELRNSTRAPFAPCAPEETIARLKALGDQLLGELGLNWRGIRGVGIAVPGHLNPQDGVVRWSQPFGWENVPLRALGETAWGTPTDVVNDSLAGGMATQFFDHGREVRNLVYVVLRFLDASHGVVGLGTGIILHGEPYHGEFGAAGEITTPVAHPLCYARTETGAAYADVPALERAVRAAEAGAVAALQRTAEELSKLVLHTINLLEPGMIVIGSDSPVMRDVVLDRLQEIIDQHRLSHGPGNTRIIPSGLGEFGIVRGAIVPVMQRIFRMPRWT